MARKLIATEIVEVHAVCLGLGFGNENTLQVSHVTRKLTLLSTFDWVNIRPSALEALPAADADPA